MTIAIAAVAMVTLTAPAVASAAVQTNALDAPGSPAATFNSWTQGQDDVTVSWTPVAEADGYEVAYNLGNTPPSSPSGNSISVPPGGSVASVETTLDAFNDTVSYSIWAYQGTPGNVSAPASVTETDIPNAPTITSMPVSGVAGQANLTWPAPADGDTLVLRRSTTGAQTPTDGTSVPISAGQTTAHVTGLANYPTLNYFSMFELAGGNDQDWSPVNQVVVQPAPAADGAVTAEVQNDAPDSATLTWARPSNCGQPFQTCDHSVVLENSGSTVAANPTDGILETPSEGVTIDYATVDDLAPGNTYTFTVFNIETVASTEVWSVPSSTTTADIEYPQVVMSSKPKTSAIAGQKVTITATVTSHGTTPTGSMDFRTDKHVLCKARPLPASDTLSCTTTAQLIGAEPAGEAHGGFDVYASYSGDTTDAATPGDLVMFIYRAAPKVKVSAARSTISRHGNDTIAAKVSGAAGPGTGTASFTIGHNTLCKNKPLKGGTATCKVTGKKLGTGARKVTVSYSGDTSYKPSKTHVTVHVKR